MEEEVRTQKRGLCIFFLLWLKVNLEAYNKTLLRTMTDYISSGHVYHMFSDAQILSRVFRKDAVMTVSARMGEAILLI